MKGYRTVIVNLLSTVIPVLELTEWRGVLPNGWLPWYILGLALANLWLRFLTDTAIGRK